MKRLLAGLGKSLLTTLIFFIVAELALRGAYAVRNSMVRLVPLPYALGDEYGPIPPWLDRLMILVPDDTTIWRNLPNVRRTYVDIFSPARRPEDRVALLRQFTTTLPPQFRGNPTWTIALNSQGYRSPEPKSARLPSTLRVACVGDSWTFGMNVDQDRTYPSRLAEQLRRAHPDKTIEVLNFGVLGYTSFQGLQLMKARVLDFHPDVVAIGFGMNDSSVAGYRDKDMVTQPPPRLVTRVRTAARELELYKLLDYFALTLKFHPKSVGDYLNEKASEKPAETADYSTLDAWTRVSPPDYETNVREMARLAAGQGARVILVDNELWGESPYRPILRRIAADTQTPFVDSFALIDAAKKQTERDIEAKLGLVPSPHPAAPARPDRTTVVFRVAHGAFPVAGAMSITGNGPELGAFKPNTVLMHDDGLEGDQRANDGVWSYRAAFAPGTRLFYVYTNSGAPGQWEGLDIPHIRQVVVPPASDGGVVYLPVETFGRIYMQADSWHTDATGYELIAEAVADAIEHQ